MTLDVDNGLPEIYLYFGDDSSTEVELLCHLDSWVAMTTGNLRVHQWLMTTNLNIFSTMIVYHSNYNYIVMLRMLKRKRLCTENQL